MMRSSSRMSPRFSTGKLRLQIAPIALSEMLLS
jgi:hypothetical protein